MDWTACRNNRLVKEIKRDDGLIGSLLLSADKKLSSSQLLPLNDTTASSKVSLMYDALREVLEATSVTRGFKVYNHECYCSFLSEVLSESSLSAQFDEFRKLRNSVNYDGRDIKADEARPVLAGMIVFISEIKKRLNSFQE